MAIEKRCDATGMKIVGPDAGAGPLHCRTPDGYLIRVEVLRGPDGEQPHLRIEAVKRMIEHNDLFPEEGADDPAVARLPRRAAEG